MLIVANWKAYVETPTQAEKLFTLAKKFGSNKKLQLVLAPSFPHLGLLTKGNRSKVLFGAQDVSIDAGGALTGEVPASLLAKQGVTYVIIGHSERRARGDSAEMIVQKVQQALGAGLRPILCVGESERDEEGKYLTTIRGELHSVFSVLSPKEKALMTIAYEPIWAIGKTALQAITAPELHEMIRYVRKVLGEYMNETAVKKIPVLYGGSVDATNAQELLSGASVDGFLVGRATTDTKTFSSLIKTLSS